jgi:hypothetical protein
VAPGASSDASKRCPGDAWAMERFRAYTDAWTVDIREALSDGGTITLSAEDLRAQARAGLVSMGMVT